jgi:predicted transposase/invertase (TIGR01784 family)
MNYEELQIPTDYASPLLDTGFKQLISLDGEGGDTIALSLFNSIVPDFQDCRIKSLKPAPLEVPLVKNRELRTLSMDFHAVTERNEHILVEIQLKRHVMFDERALFHAARAYSNQISKDLFKLGCWYEHLKKTYSIQIVDYNSNRIRGIRKQLDKDTLLERVNAHPMKSGDFMKHYVMTDRFSGQQIDHLQMIQLELPRAEKIMNLFPPTSEFTIQQWWISFFNHSEQYTSEYIEKLYEEKIMPQEIYEGLGRMKFDKWTPSMKEAYQQDLNEIRRLYSPQIAMDLNEAEERGREEGEKRGEKRGELKGRMEGKREMARKMLRKGVDVLDISEFTELSISEIELLQKAMK